MKIIQRLSPNFNERKVTPAPDFLILHYTGMTSAIAALNRMCDPQTEVSAHYLVDEAGLIYQMVAEDKRAWHAGVSSWRGLVDMNSRSIGIEISNPGLTAERHTHPFPAVQMAAVTDLCRDILTRHNIPAAQILAHSDIAPDRKNDPGELFDWRGLAAAGIGLWPQGDAALTVELDEALTHFGYAPAVDLKARLIAFQRHFHPEIFATPERVGTPDAETLARLARLLAQQNL